MDPGLASLAIDVELMFGDRPKYTCMEQCREHIKEIAEVAKQQRLQLEAEMRLMHCTTHLNAMEEWENFMKNAVVWLGRWMEMARQELHFIQASLTRLPHNPTLLYAMPPPDDALHIFYPALYPTVTEPADVREYKDIVQEFK